MFYSAVFLVYNRTYKPNNIKDIDLSIIRNVRKMTQLDKKEVYNFTSALLEIYEDMTIKQLNLLTYVAINNKDGCTLTDIMRDTGMVASAASRTIRLFLDNNEKHYNFLTHRLDAKDSRKRLIFLGENALRLLK